MSTIFHGDDLTYILRDRQLPSHEWAKKAGVDHFEDVTRVAEAEFTLIEAIKGQKDHEGIKTSWVVNTDQKAIDTARQGVADAYLAVGIAHDAEEAAGLAKKAQTTINHNLHHESVEHSARR